MSKKLFFYVLLAAILVFNGAISFAQTTILAGVKGGSYEQIANDISKISIHPVITKSSSGSVDNFEQLMSGKGIDVTFLQEDVLYKQQAKDLEKGTNYIRDIRVLIPLGIEEIHLVARKDDNTIQSLKDLNGKKVAIGDKKQGTYVTATMIKEKTNAKWIDVSEPMALDKVIADLNNKTIDAFFFVGASPVSKLHESLNIKLVPITDERLKEIYVKTVIRSGYYDFVKSDIQTYGVKSLVVTSVADETEAHKRAIDFLLCDIKDHITELYKNGHKKWTEIDINYNRLDWEPYETAEEIFHPKTDSKITILSGVTSGSYYQLANDIKNVTPQTITVKSTNGSADNMNQLIQRETFYMAFMQSDVLFQEKFNDQKNGTKFMDNIKLLLPLGQEEIHLITRKDAKIKRISQLKGKKVAVGSLNSGTHVTASVIKQISGTKWIDVPVSLDSAMAGLLDKSIDAVFFVSLAPVSKFAEFPADANLKFIPLKSRGLRKIYTSTTIKKGTYPWQSEDEKTYAVKSILATNDQFETPQQAYNMTRLLNDIKTKIETLKLNGHPKWKEMDFDFKDCNWSIYEGATDVFMRGKQPVENKLNR